MKIWIIAWKDTLIRFRDRNALILMLVAPLIVAGIIGAAFGNLFANSGATPIQDIPIIIVNEDAGDLGQQFVNTLTGAESAQLAELFEPTRLNDLSAARAAVQSGDARAAIYIPANFSDSLTGGEESTIQLYTDPAASLTPNITRAVVAGIANGFSNFAITTQVFSTSLSDDLPTLGPAAAELDLSSDHITSLMTELFTADPTPNSATISLNRIAVGEVAEAINPLVIFAPSMGLFFLMFTMMDGTRAILTEDQEGTLGRLLTTPTSHTEILLGKIGGVFLTGILQFLVYILASSLIFQISWTRSIPGLLLMSLTVIAAFTSLGALIAGFARDITQAGILGSVVVLISSVLGGNFVPAQQYPNWLDQLSKITINRWALDGFYDLTLNRLGFSDILPEATVVLGMAAVFFAAGLWQFRRRIAR